MTQLPTWLKQMQTEAKSLMPSLKLPKADRTNIKNWEFEAIKAQTSSTYKNEIPSAVAHLISTEEQNVLILCDGNIVYKRLSDTFEGVIIANL